METKALGNRQVLLRYVLPQMLGLLANSVYFIVDGIFIGNRLGANALAATGVAVPALEFLIALSMLVGTGAGVLISQHIGGGRKGEARRVFNLVFWGGVGLALLVGALGTCFTPPLARMMGATADILPHTVEYLGTFFWFSPFFLLSFVLATFARNNGRPKLAMLALTVGSLANILLDWVFMYPLDLGLFGAALATGIGPVVSVCILLPTFFSKKGVLRFERPRRTPGVIGGMLAAGLPAFVAEFSIGLVTLLYNRAIVAQGLGAFGLAAYLVIGYAALLTLTAFLGAAEGVQPVVGMLYGAGQEKRIRSLLRYTGIFLVVLGVAFYLLLALWGARFYGIFIKDDACLLGFTSEKASLYFLCLPMAGVNILMVSFLQCVARPGRALVVSLLRSVVLVALFLAVLPGVFAEGMWLAVPLTETVTLLVALLLWHGSALHKQATQKSVDAPNSGVDVRQKA